MPGPLLQARLTARLVAPRAVFGAVAAISLFVEAGFLTAAFWIVLSTAFVPLSTALVLALLFFGIAIRVLAYGRRPPRLVSPRTAERLADPARPAPPDGLTSTGLPGAFLWGLDAGRGRR